MYVLMFLMSVDLYTRFPLAYQGQNILALIHYIIFITLFTIPLAKIPLEELKLVHPNISIVNFVSIGILVFSLLGVKDIFENFYTGIIGLMTDDDYGAQLYHELRNSSSFESKKGIGLSSITSVLNNLAKSIAPLFALYYISHPKKNVFISGGLLISASLVILAGVSSGSRFAIISSMMNIIAFLYVMNNYYTKQIKRIVNIIVIAIASVSLIGVASITMSRALRGNSNPLESVENYTSQACLVYGKYAFDAGGVRYGDRTIPFFKSLFSSNVARTYTDRVDKYSYMKVNESSFISFIGDFILDFGVFFGSILLLLILVWFNRKLKPKAYIGLDYLIIIYIALVNINGFYSYQYVDFGGNLSLILLLLLHGFFKKTKHFEYK